MNSFDYDSFTRLLKGKYSYQSTFKSVLLLWWCQYPSFVIELGLYVT